MVEVTGVGVAKSLTALFSFAAKSTDDLMLLTLVQVKVFPSFFQFPTTNTALTFGSRSWKIYPAVPVNAVQFATSVGLVDVPSNSSIL